MFRELKESFNYEIPIIEMIQGGLRSASSILRLSHCCQNNNGSQKLTITKCIKIMICVLICTGT